MKRTIISTLALLCLALTSLSAQNHQCNCRGQVIDQNTQQPIPYAVVEVNGTYQYTDEKGQFELSGHEMPMQLCASQMGYGKAHKEMTSCSQTMVFLALPPKPLELSTITVEGDRGASTPLSTVVQDNAKLVSQPVDIGDLLREQPGFGLIKRGGYALDPVFRSFKAEQLNIIYDGGVQVVHACPGRMDPISTHVNPSEIKALEIVKGPFSVRHGQTMGGVVNIVTDDQAPAPGWGGFAEVGYESNGDSRLTQAGLEYSTSIADFSVSGGLKDFGNYQSGDGTTIPSAFRAYDYSLSAGLSPNANQRLQASWRQSFGRDILHAGLMMDTDSDDASVFSLDYKVQNLSPKLYGLTVKAYGSQVDHAMSNARRPNFMMVEAVATVQSQTLGGKVEANWLPGAKSILYTGLDYRRISRSGERVRTIKRNMMTGEPLPQPMVSTDPIWQDAYINDVGAYAEYRYLISDRLSWNSGLRLDWVNANSNAPAPGFTEQYGLLEAQNDLNLSLNSSLNAQLSDEWSLQLALGRGTRSANMIERYIYHFNLGVDPFEYLGNPNLKPEANHQAELSIRFEGERWQVGGNVFYSLLTDYITAAVDSTLPRKYMPMSEPRFARRFTNIDRAMQAGFEWDAAYRFNDRLSVYTLGAYTHAHNQDWDEPLAQITPLEGSLGIKYQRERWWTDLRSRFVAEQNRVSPTFGETTTPGFQTYDLRMGAEVLPGLNLGFSILNILDANYYEHLSWAYRNMPEQGILYEPGRNFALLLKYDF